MNEDYTKRFVHIAVDIDELLGHLGIDGRATDFWKEEGANYLHVKVQLDDEATGGTVVARHQYVEQTSFWKETQTIAGYPMVYERWFLGFDCIREFVRNMTPKEEREWRNGAGQTD